MSGVLLFGGTFDPIHHGHLIVARSARERLGVERVVLIPSASPPHKDARRITAFADRAAMCRLAVEGEKGFEVSEWEGAAPSPNYTLMTVKHFASEAPGVDLYWLLGLDSLNELPTWYRVSELADRCTLVTAMRPGHAQPNLEGLRAVLSDAQIRRIASHVLPTPHVEISATEIRERVRGGLSVRYLVPEGVCGYIRAHGLYVREGSA